MYALEMDEEQVEAHLTGLLLDSAPADGAKASAADEEDPDSEVALASE